MNKGTFYGVGIGPGDPELLTLKAVRVLEQCPVIAAPCTKSGQMLAWDIARQAADLDGKALLPLHFTMSPDKARQHAAHVEAAALVERELRAGRDVAMLNLGDVSIYATFTYLRQLLEEQGYTAAMVPGVPSFCAVAARLGQSLTAGEEPLHVFPANAADLDEALALPGTKVLMKSGRQLAAVAESIGRQAKPCRAALVVDCGLPTEGVYERLEDVPEEPGYFATVVVK